MKLWLDDVRPAPPGWERAASAERAIALLETGEVKWISLDHDLGMGGSTQTASGLWVCLSPNSPASSGYDVAAWIERAAWGGRIGRMVWDVHSANPVGRARIIAAMESAERAWEAKT